MDKIPVKSDCKKLDRDGYVASCLKPRSTEEAALRPKPRYGLTADDVRVANLDRVAACPPCYPEIDEKPMAAIFGLARLRWIASKMNTSARAVQLQLIFIERKLMQMGHADLGLEDPDSVHRVQRR